MTSHQVWFSSMTRSMVSTIFSWWRLEDMQNSLVMRLMYSLSGSSFFFFLNSLMISWKVWVYLDGQDFAINTRIFLLNNNDANARGRSTANDFGIAATVLVFEMCARFLITRFLFCLWSSRSQIFQYIGFRHSSWLWRESSSIRERRKVARRRWAEILGIDSVSWIDRRIWRIWWRFIER